MSRTQRTQRAQRNTSYKNTLRFTILKNETLRPLRPLRSSWTALRMRDERRRPKQRVVRIDLVDVFGGDHLMVNEDGWRNGPPREDVERKPDQIVAIALGKVGHRGDERGARIAKFSARIRFGVLPGDRAVCVAAGLLEGARGAQRARVVGGADQNAPRLRLTEMSADALERGLELPVAVDADDRRVRGPMERFDDAREDAARSRTHQRAGTGELEEQNLVDLAVPSALRPAAQIASGEHAGLVVVRAEVGRAGMRNVDGDNRDTRLEVARGDLGR